MTKLDLYNQYVDTMKEVCQIFLTIFKEPYVDFHVKEFKDMAEGIPETLDAARDWMKQYLIGDIIIHFPKVTIENEYGETHDIYDLFVRVQVNGLGCLVNSFEIKRTSFTLVEVQKGYVHSHTPRKHSVQGLQEFDHVCLGSGPIRNTMSRLRCQNEEYLWLLFCNELSLYVRTESVSGGPYIRMSELSNGTGIQFKNLKTPIMALLPSNVVTKVKIRNLISLLLEKADLKFSYYKGKYCLGETFNDIVIKTAGLTEEFPVTLEVTFDGKTFYSTNGNTNVIPSNFRTVMNKKAFEFRGKDIYFKLVDEQDEMKPFEIVHPDFTREALNIILLLINNYYAGDNEEDGNDTSTTTEETSNNKKHIKYNL